MLTATYVQDKSWNPSFIYVDGVKVVPIASQSGTGGCEYVYVFNSGGNALVSCTAAPGYSSVVSLTNISFTIYREHTSNSITKTC